MRPEESYGTQTTTGERLRTRLVLALCALIGAIIVISLLDGYGWPGGRWW